LCVISPPVTTKVVSLSIIFITISLVHAIPSKNHWHIKCI
jgi:hypothetical protein